MAENDEGRPAGAPRELDVSASNLPRAHDADTIAPPAPVWRRRFLRRVRAGAAPAAAARELGIDRKRATEHRRSNPAFAIETIAACAHARPYESRADLLVDLACVLELSGVDVAEVAYRMRNVEAACGA